MKTREKVTVRVDLKKIIRSRPEKIIRYMPGFMIRFLKWLIKEKEINEGLKKIGHLKNFEFIEAIIEHLNMDIEVIGEENIPDHPDVIFVGNHALGGPDFFALMHVLRRHYSSVNHLTNDVLMGFTQLQDFFVPVNVFGKNPEKYKRILTERLEKSEAPITIFPSGEVARYRNGKWDDGLWRSGFVRFAKKYRKTVVPFFIPTKNSRLFYAVNKIRTRLGIKANLELFLLSREMFKKRNSRITIIFGKPIPPGFFTDDKSVHEWADVVKKMTYQLGETYAGKEKNTRRTA